MRRTGGNEVGSECEGEGQQDPLDRWNALREAPNYPREAAYGTDAGDARERDDVPLLPDDVASEDLQSHVSWSASRSLPGAVRTTTTSPMMVEM